ncbi:MULTISPECIES: DGQHR domain-containing protein [unclassified Rhizobium]|nr:MULTISPECIES: DGQHR domain-containing protein [unclassified Rhizobium]MDH7810043.1 DNA sulfur modification protein DndB [Rhizobium sp. AN67]SOD50266.1 DNA sulfur modification protein DndB [Rhizobium sp. AN6A]
MKIQPITLPALRGTFGDWIYYICLIPLEELGRRAMYAHEIHPNKALSELIQRSLEGPRAAHIATYLETVPERFFSSLVLATYGGAPDWLEVGNFRANGDPKVIAEIPDALTNSMGFLRLNGREIIFALDGQHRLAGIKKALKDGLQAPDDAVPIILVGHKKTKTGLQRTRRLFTTLNKTAVPVRKRDIIALDEDDVMAIVVRRLVENDPRFQHPKIAVIASQNLPTSNTESLTTISSLYDVLKDIFMYRIGQRSDRSLRFNRPSDDRLDAYEAYALEYFDALAKAFPPVKTLMGSSNPQTIVKRFRGDHGGHVLFRPVGLDIITKVAIAYARERKTELSDAVLALNKIPVDLTKPPYRDVIWDATRERMIVRGKVLARELLKYMVGLPVDAADLKRNYRVALGVDPTDTKVRLPAKL